MTIEGMISKSTALEGYNHRVAYDENLNISYGYWICKVCKSSFYRGSDPIHYRGCKMLSDKEMIYVFGPWENSDSSPLKKDDIERIKAVVSAKL